tara:strand:- start:251 stop:994 length:744 start_codon:yes stop_codon:yes gene_type:complete
MKNFLHTCIALIFSVSLNAQFYWTSEHVTLKEGTEQDYEQFEAFWGVAKEKAIADGLQAGWSIWKVDPSSNDNNPWADYIIINIYESMEQLEAPVDWMELIQEAHKGKTKRSVIRKYIKEGQENKYRARTNTYIKKSISNLSEDGMDPEGGVTASYISMEQLNDDYVDFETQYFRERHKGYKYWWDFSEILDRSENAYKPITHSIFEINKDVEGSQDESFVDKMMVKYGIASRKMHGWLQVDLVMSK